MKKIFFLLNLSSILFLLFAISCMYDIPVEEVRSNKEYILSIELDTIITSSNHLAFPDIINYKDSIWLLAYRESDKHVYGSFSRIKILKSSDFKKWEEINSYEIKGFDLRDPKFSLDKERNKLYLHFHSASENGTMGKYANYRYNYYCVFNNSTKRFNTETDGTITTPDLFPQDWLWKPIWNRGVMLAGGYLKKGLRFYKYEDILGTPLVFSELNENSPSECALLIDNNKIYALVRRDGDTLIGNLSISMDSLMNIQSSSNEVSFNWTSIPIRELGGPNMVVVNGIIYIAGRADGITSIYAFDPKSQKVNHVLSLPFNGENGYPGLFSLKNNIFGVYYTQNSSLSFEIRTFIIKLN